MTTRNLRTPARGRRRGAGDGWVKASGTVAAAAVAALTGCGLAHTVDRELLANISIENKLLLFDAENDVSIAIDERDKLQRQIRESKEDIAYAEAQVEDARSDGERAAKKNDDKGEQVAAVAREVYELKIDWLEAELDLHRARLAAQESLINVALARYELAKAKLVKKNNVLGATEIELEAFEAQVAALVEAAKAEQEELAQREAEVEQVKGVWLARREQLSGMSGGGAGSAWAEDSALWGGR